MSLDFVAIDFETANADLASICQVGVAVVRNGEIHKVEQWEVQPATGYESFDARNVAIHGVTPDMAKAGLPWNRSLERLHEIVGNSPVVSHNARFDSSAAYWASVASGQNPPEWPWYCTLLHLQDVITLPSYKLSDISRHFGIELDHHRAGSDAHACAQGLLAAHRQTEVSPWDNRWQATRRARGSSRHEQAAGIPISRYKRVAELPPANPNPPSDSPFAGTHAVVTGNLPEMSRDEAIEVLAAWGSQPQLNVTKKTTVLILGDSEVARVSRSNGSGKERKAAELIESGQTVRLMTGVEFLEIVNPRQAPDMEEEVEAAPNPQPQGIFKKLWNWIAGEK